jgi:hypothetical protein
VPVQVAIHDRARPCLLPIIEAPTDRKNEPAAVCLTVDKVQVTAKQLAIQVGKEMSEKGAYRLRTAEVIGATSERLACAKLLKSERRFCEPSGPLRTILSLFILSAVRIFRRNVCDIPFRIASSDPFRSMQMVAVTSC